MSEKRKLQEGSGKEEGSDKRAKIDGIDDEEGIIDHILQLKKINEPEKEDGSSKTRKLKSCVHYTAFPPNYVEPEFQMPDKPAREW